MNLTVAAQPFDFTFPLERTALLIIDMQRDFVEPGGFGASLGNDVGLLQAIIPTVQRVLDEIKAMNTVKMSTNHSPIFADANHDALFCLEMWEEINFKLIAAISACAMTVEKRQREPPSSTSRSER